MKMKECIQRSGCVVLTAVYARDTIQSALQDVLVAVGQNSLVSIHHVPS